MTPRIWRGNPRGVGHNSHPKNHDWLHHHQGLDHRSQRLTESALREAYSSGVTTRLITANVNAFQIGSAALRFRADDETGFSASVWSQFERSTGHHVNWDERYELWSFRADNFRGEAITIFPTGERTVGEMYRLVGRALGSTPPRISILHGGLGSAGWLPELWQIVGEVQTGLALYKGVRWGINRLRTATNRAAVADWHTTGEMSMTLQQMVCAQARWRERTFRRSFGVNARDAAELLRAFGYSRRPGGIWTETEQGKHP